MEYDEPPPPPQSPQINQTHYAFPAASLLIPICTTFLALIWLKKYLINNFLWTSEKGGQMWWPGREYLSSDKIRFPAQSRAQGLAGHPPTHTPILFAHTLMMMVVVVILTPYDIDGDDDLLSPGSSKLFASSARIIHYHLHNWTSFVDCLKFFLMGKQILMFFCVQTNVLSFVT